MWAEEEDQVLEEEATGASSIPVCLMRPCSACMEDQATLPATQVPVARRDTGSTQSLCPPSLCLLCQDQEELASLRLLCLQRSP